MASLSLSLFLSLCLSLSLQEFVKGELEKFCSALGHLEAECKDLIGSYFDMIWEAILDGLVRFGCVSFDSSILTY